MKSILISIQPKWCKLIASGIKTVEVRKTKPKLETPFKVYIYCTKDNTDILPSRIWWKMDKTGFQHILNGMIIGEFVCDTFITDRTFGHDALFNAAACMSDAEVAAYCVNKEMYGWHISDLVIYDTPRELSEFYTICPEYDKDEPICEGCDFEHTVYCGADCPPYFECKCEGRKPLKRPPQSWCYVEVQE